MHFFLCVLRVNPGESWIQVRILDRNTITKVALQDLFKSFDQNIQVDVAILDFSKAFDTVPHDKLLHKINS